MGKRFSTLRHSAQISLGLGCMTFCLVAAEVQSAPAAKARTATATSAAQDAAQAKAAKARAARAKLIRAKAATKPNQSFPMQFPPPPPPLQDSKRLPYPPPPPPSPPLPRTFDTAPDETFRVEATPDGKSVYAVGTLVQGSFTKLKKVFDANASAESLIIASPGGVVIEGAKMAHYIRSRNISVIVHNMCSSACTMVLAAGKERSAMLGARIGFHKSYAPLTTSYALLNVKGVEALSDTIMRQSFDKSSIEINFVNKALAVPSTTLWYPPQDTLMASKVLSRQAKTKDVQPPPGVALNRDSIAEKLFQTPFWKEAQRANPSVVDEAVDHSWMTAMLTHGDVDHEETALSYLTKRMIRALPALSDASLGLVVTALNTSFTKKVVNGQSFCFIPDSLPINILSEQDTMPLASRQSLVIEMLKVPDGNIPISDDNSRAMVAAVIIEFGVANGADFTVGPLIYGGPCRTSAAIYSHLASLNQKDRAQLMRALIAFPEAASQLDVKSGF